jgi:hypothetical protein
MLTCNLQGGLGNQLFQIYTTIAHAERTNSKFFFLNIKELKGSVTDRYTYWETFFSTLKPYLLDPELIDKTNLVIIKEKGFTYSLLSINNLSKIRILSGYFQSFKYFDNNFSDINRLLKIDILKVDLTNKYLKLINEDTPISMHFRLGDYKKLPDHYTILGVEYYKTALNYLITNKTLEKTVLYFCEEPDLEEVDNMIQHIRMDFPGLTFVRADPELADWEQLILMSLCKHNIIANSTFSWWGAYLNTSREKIVVCPLTWFGSRLQQSHNLKDLFPEKWIKI